VGSTGALGGLISGGGRRSSAAAQLQPLNCRHFKFRRP
jgi:hypothetical protein